VVIRGWQSQLPLDRLFTAMSKRSVTVPENAIWRAANLLIQQHGAAAELEATRRAEAMLKRGDYYGQRLWVEIRRGILGYGRGQRRRRHNKTPRRPQRSQAEPGCAFRLRYKSPRGTHYRRKPRRICSALTFSIIRPIVGELTRRG
jgi:hypothetical protein